MAADNRQPDPAGGPPDLDESVVTSLGSELIGPGGKVDPHAIASAVERARARARERGDDSAEPELPRVTFTLQRDLGTRLDKYLTTRITFMSRTQLQRLIESGGVTVHGQPAKASTRLGRGAVVEVVVPPPPDPTIQPENIPISVLFEDEHMIVLNKSADIIVHPARAENSGTLVHALAWHFRHVSRGGLSGVGHEYARPGVVHRLDRHTSGCIVFAKTDEAHWKLAQQFERRTADKRYLAVAEGWIEPAADVIDLPLGPHPSRDKGYREKQVVRHDDLGKPAVTIFRVRERYELPADHAAAQRRFTLVELELKTGRTHQIRVHLAHRGWPIVGDDMYGGRAHLAADGATLMDRQALHAALLALEHPITREPMVFTAPPRAELAACIADLRARAAVSTLHVEGAVPLARFGL